MRSRDQKRGIIARVASWLRMTEPILQAGAIVVRRQRGQSRVLIVSAHRNRKRWVLPKGTVRKGEHVHDAALRETREEAGVTGWIRGRAGVVEYNARAGRVRVEYFLVEYRGHLDGDHEHRRVKWCAVDDAIKLLTVASARRLLSESNDDIEQLARKPGRS